MNKLAATSAALVAVSSLSGAAVLSSAATATAPGPAPVERATHTKKLLLNETASHDVGKTSFVGTDRIRSASTHEVIGYDSLSGRFNEKTGKVSVHVAVALRGGIMLGKVSFIADAGPEFAGTITQGSGRYDGVTGTITGRFARHGRTFVTLRYTL
jgi:hypothetical protein